MRLLPPLPAVGAALGCLCSLLSAGCGKGEPRLVIPQARHEFGPVLAGETSRHTFVVKNEGKAPLRIKDVEVNCGCVAPSFPKTLEPGKGGEVLVRFEAFPHWSGHIERVMKVVSNDPKRPTQELTITAEVEPILKVEPANPLEIPYRPGETLTRELTITPRKGSGVKVLRLNSPTPLVKATLEPAPKNPDDPYRARLTIGPCEGQGDFSVNLQIRTTSPQLPLAVLALQFKAQGGPVVEPPEIFVSSMDSGQPRELGSFKVYSRSGPLRVMGVETGNPAVTARITPGDEPGTHMVRIAAPRGLPPGTLSTEIRVVTDAPVGGTITLPLVAMVNPAPGGTP